MFFMNAMYSLHDKSIFVPRRVNGGTVISERIDDLVGGSSDDCIDVDIGPLPPDDLCAKCICCETCKCGEECKNHEQCECCKEFIENLECKCAKDCLCANHSKHN